MDVPALIRAALTATELTQAQFAREAGVSQGSVSKWLNGRESPTVKQWDKVEGFLRKHPKAGHLVREIREYRLDDLPDDAQFPAGISSLKPYAPKILNGMPVVDVTAGAGGGGLVVSPTLDQEGGVVYAAEGVRGEISLPPLVIASLTSASFNRIHWLGVRGDSMEPTLSGGDWIAVNTADAMIGQGGIFAIRDQHGEVMVKRLRLIRGSDEKQIEIISDNPKQGNDIEDADNLSIIGRVVARIARVG